MEKEENNLVVSSAEVKPEDRFNRGEFIILQALCLVTIALYIVSAFVKESDWEDYLVNKYFLAGFFFELVAWALFAVFLRKLPETRRVTKALFWKVGLYLAGGVMAVPAIYFYGTDGTLLLLSLVLGCLLGGLVFHVVAAERMLRVTYSKFPLKLLGQVILISFAIPLVIGFADAGNAISSGEAPIRPFHDFLIIFNVLPFIILYTVMERGRRTLLNTKTKVIR